MESVLGQACKNVCYPFIPLIRETCRIFRKAGRYNYGLLNGGEAERLRRWRCLQSCEELTLQRPCVERSAAAKEGALRHALQQSKAFGFQVARLRVTPKAFGLLRSFAAFVAVLSKCDTSVGLTALPRIRYALSSSGYLIAFPAKSSWRNHLAFRVRLGVCGEFFHGSSSRCFTPSYSFHLEFAICPGSASFSQRY